MKKDNGTSAVIVAAAVAAVLLVIFGSLWLVKNGVTNAGNRKENALNAQYKVNQNTLSNCEVQSEQAVQVAVANKDAFDKIITDAVKGRYSPGSSAQVGSGALFSAIQEQYPDLTPVSKIYQDLLNIVTGCRTDYMNMQSKLVDMLGNFDAWRTGSFRVRQFGGGFPNDNLVARLGDQKTTGKDAEEQMWKIVLTGSSLKEYEDGTLDTTTLPGLSTATTTTSG